MNRLLKAVAALLFWLSVWQATHLLIGDSLRMFLPSPAAVAAKLSELIVTADFHRAVLLTLLRIFAGFIGGIAVGAAAGILTASVPFADTVLSPAFRIVRAVPVVSFIILAFLFISTDTLPVFISFLMVVPLIWQTVHDGIKGTDIKLIEMSRVMRLGKMKTLFFVCLPSALPSIFTSCVNALGLAWKSGVAAEVMFSPSISVGRLIYRSKGNLEFDSVYALTLTVVILSMIIESLLKYLCAKSVTGKAAKK